MTAAADKTGQQRTGRPGAFALRAPLAFAAEYRHKVPAGRHLARPEKITRAVRANPEVTREGGRTATSTR